MSLWRRGLLEGLPALSWALLGALVVAAAMVRGGSVEQMAGSAHIPSAPMIGGTSTVTGSGDSQTVDNVPETAYRIGLNCLADPVFPWPNPHTVTGQRFRVYQAVGGIYESIYDDPNATYVVERENRPDLGVYPNGDPWVCPKTVTITGGGAAGTYSCVLTNMTRDGQDRLVMDFALTASPNLIQGYGAGGGEDPPIVRH